MTTQWLSWQKSSIMKPVLECPELKKMQEVPGATTVSSLGASSIVSTSSWSSVQLILLSGKEEAMNTRRLGQPLAGSVVAGSVVEIAAVDLAVRGSPVLQLFVWHLIFFLLEANEVGHQVRSMLEVCPPTV